MLLHFLTRFVFLILIACTAGMIFTSAALPRGVEIHKDRHLLLNERAPYRSPPPPPFSPQGPGTKHP
ncbi:hypothetical protein QJS10_CPB13g00735 [Acorus calamus]|uniref:Uncharacterized protein n=1 Tax=Acorus calamus TaxID=4465 RepID=A0AAV9DJQ1_ACOCL|nr:hypothetical protein QJS10_CPB13g00735 [Acorus calamus]